MLNEQQEQYIEHEDFPKIGEIKFVAEWNQNKKELTGGYFEFTESGEWVEV